MKFCTYYVDLLVESTTVQSKPPDLNEIFRHQNLVTRDKGFIPAPERRFLFRRITVTTVSLLMLRFFQLSGKFTQTLFNILCVSYLDDEAMNKHF